jgi:hypothetical protein
MRYDVERHKYARKFKNIDVFITLRAANEIYRFETGPSSLYIFGV